MTEESLSLADQELVRRARHFENLVARPEWDEFVRMVAEQRDSWLSQTQTSQDRTYLTAQAQTVNLLTKAPYDVIEQKDALLAELTRREIEARESDKPSPDEPFMAHPPPQPV